MSSSGPTPQAESKANSGSGSVRSPSEFVKSLKGRSVVVKLSNNSSYKGVLACLDGYMNIAMEQTEVK